MAATTIGDVIPRNLIMDYVGDELKTKSVLMATGVVEVDQNPQFATNGGQTFTIPHVKALTSKGQDQALAVDTALTVKSVGTYSEVGVICRFGDALGFADTAKLAAGTDLFGAVAPQLTEVIARDLEEKLIAAIQGVLGVAGFSTHIFDGSGADFSLLGVSQTKALLGTGRQKLRAMFVHSDVGAFLERHALTRYVDVGAFGENVLLSGVVPVVSGLIVVENDELCAPTDSVYPTYLMGPNALYLGYQRDINIEYDRNILLEGGTDIVKWDVHFSPHVRGSKWVGSLSSTPLGPSLADLATSAKWNKVAQKAEDTLVVRYDHLIS